MLFVYCHEISDSTTWISIKILLFLSHIDNNVNLSGYPISWTIHQEEPIFPEEGDNSIDVLWIQRGFYRRD